MQAAEVNGVADDVLGAFEKFKAQVVDKRLQGWEHDVARCDLALRRIDDDGETDEIRVFRDENADLQEDCSAPAAEEADPVALQLAALETVLAEQDSAMQTCVDEFAEAHERLLELK